ncbi:MAG: 6-phosphofructokinase, partial [Nitrospirota bacterium]|nr:6-phosphofructokinase [Nitrospirota bacterium]
MPSPLKKIGILVGGGPAPGINSVIEAATLRSLAKGLDVIGILDGFQWLMRGETHHVCHLTDTTVNRIHFQGGSFLRTARANPTRDPQHLKTTLAALQQLQISALITIGGDDTASSAMKLAAAASGALQVVHVPKTIDNDLCLPHGVSAFGFQTARHYGVEIVKNLMVDAATTSRWYLAVAMGRKAGHLALGIGRASGNAITIIPEEFSTPPIRLADLSNILLGSIIKRLGEGRSDGVAVLAEGLTELLDPEDLAALGDVERDEHGNIRFAELDIGQVLKDTVKAALTQHGIPLTIVTKNIGYELRCADPIPFDIEYTRDLGFCAAQFVIGGGTGAMVSLQNGHFVPMYFDDIFDHKTKRTKVRM